MASALTMLARPVLALLALAACANAARTSTAASMTLSLRATARFRAEVRRMQQERMENEATLERSLSLPTAFDIFAKKQGSRKALSMITQVVYGRNHSHLPRQQELLATGFTPTNSLATARDMLGSMITEAYMEYDQQHSACASFFRRQCSLMETSREDISSANAMAAEWRAKVIGAQKEINVIQVNLPHLEDDLKSSASSCNTRLGYLRRDLSVVLNDVEVMSKVLGLTDCTSGGAFLQSSAVPLCDCPASGSVTRAITGGLAVAHPALNRSLAKLQTHHARKMVQEGLLEVAQDPTKQGPELAPVDGTIAERPQLPEEAIPDDPCSAIGYEGDGGRCTLRSTPACFNLQNKFLSIQGSILDKRDDLIDEIAHFSSSCEATRKTLQAEMEMSTARLGDQHTKLAEATSGENTAGEDSQMKAEEHSQLKSQMMEARTSCSTKLRTLESEMCALRKIRGELFKMKGDTHPFFQDCEVAEWQPMECSASCGGGTQQLVRAVVVPTSSGGAACPPLRQVQRCNDHPCPMDCVVSEWSGWSACSAQCGGGVRERARSVRTEPKYEGNPCGYLEETESCNMGACDRDCELAEWSEWTVCSKACNMGTSVRKRAVEKAATGRGKCPAEDSSDRLEMLPCNTQACVRDASVAMVCKNKIDLVLLLDGSGSIGEAGWEATKNFAKKLADGFLGAGTDAMLSIILFSGPQTFSSLEKCMSGSGTADVNMAADCSILVVQHFSKDLATTTSNILAMTWPKGSTLTSQALEMAKAEFTLGRGDATPILLTVTDGLPLSSRATSRAAASVKEQARLLFAAVNLNNNGLRQVVSWGSKPSSENVLRVTSFESLESLDTIDTLIEDICPSLELPTR